MVADERLELLSDGFECLTDEGKEYILAISQALVFAQNSMIRPPLNDGEKIKSA